MGCQSEKPVPSGRSFAFPSWVPPFPLGQIPQDPKTKVSRRWASSLEAETHSHLWYLWLFPECPGVGRGLRGDELPLLGVLLQWGCGGATPGEAVPLSQNERQQWRRSRGRWMPRGGLRGPHMPLEENGQPS